jgi:hypothetical protein
MTCFRSGESAPSLKQDVRFLRDETDALPSLRKDPPSTTHQDEHAVNYFTILTTASLNKGPTQSPRVENARTPVE